MKNQKYSNIRKFVISIYLNNNRYDVFRDNSGTEVGGLVLHPKFNLPYVLVNGFQYIALADAYRLFPGCKKSCRILRNMLKREFPLQLTHCTWEEVSFTLYLFLERTHFKF